MSEYKNALTDEQCMTGAVMICDVILPVAGPNLAVHIQNRDWHRIEVVGAVLSLIAKFKTGGSLEDARRLCDTIAHLGLAIASANIQARNN